MRCVLHIGTEKTGTTVLQDWLYANIGRLSAQRVYLSKILGATNNRLFPAFFRTDLDEWAREKNLKTIAEKERYFEKFLPNLAKEIEKAAVNHDVFLITSEHLHSRVTTLGDIKKIHKFLSRHFEQTQILCYFRNQADMALSSYSTELKFTSSAHLSDFLKKVTPENYYYNFLAIADNWGGIFGRKNCLFRVYDQESFVAGDIRKDFADAVFPGIDLEQFDFSIGRSNKSLSALQAKIFRLINEHEPYWDLENGGVNIGNLRLKREIVGVPSFMKGKITSDDMALISHLFEKSNTAFLNKYLKNGQKILRHHGIEGPDEQMSLTEVEEIVQDVAEFFIVRMKNKSSLHDHDADTLRDIAIRLERFGSVALKDSAALMELAKRARPSGPLINRKLEYYRKKMKEGTQ